MDVEHDHHHPHNHHSLVHLGAFLVRTLIVWGPRALIAYFLLWIIWRFPRTVIVVLTSLLLAFAYVWWFRLRNEAQNSRIRSIVRGLEHSNHPLQ